MAVHWGSALPGQGDPLYSLPAHGKRALTYGGSPPFLNLLAARCGSALPSWDVPIYPLDVCG